MEYEKELPLMGNAQAEFEFASVRSPYVRIEQLTIQEQVNALSYVAGSLHAFLTKKGGSALESDAISAIAAQLHITVEEVRSGVQFGEQDGKFMHNGSHLKLS